jgi:hypothetical protein
MADGVFQFEDCPLKHYIRREVWVKRCKNRLKRVRDEAKKESDKRRLTYFTFCAVGALDVITLEMEKVIRRSSKGWFDTVCFFDANEEFVLETSKRIPGATGFPKDFVKVVLHDDPNAAFIDSTISALEAPEHESDTLEVREKQRTLELKKQFVNSFPFDVVNLDLEQYFFKPSDPLPGKVVNALRKVFEWQRRRGKLQDGNEYQVEEFTLFFTTQIGPKNMGDDYLSMLKDYLEQNLNRYPKLRESYRQKSGGRDIATFAEEEFDNFFTLAVPKTLASILKEEDWQIDPAEGFNVYGIERPSKDGPYTILHFAMDVKRVKPARTSRPPGSFPKTAEAEYEKAIEQIFLSPLDQVEELLKANRVVVESHLEKVKAHRDRLYAGRR